MKLAGVFALFFLNPLYAQRYEDRLDAIEDMATISPGYIYTGHNGRTLGAFGGIFVQTEWQLKTGRDEIPAWSHINYYLTLAPYEFFQLYLKEGREGCDKSINKTVCSIWTNYFAYSDVRLNGTPRRLTKKIIANRMLWKAHKASIDYALLKRPRLFEEMNTPLEEKRYLRGWIRFVDVLAISSVPTSEYFIRILARPSSPHCSPLGAPDCELQDLPQTSRAFVKEIIRLGR